MKNVVFIIAFFFSGCHSREQSYNVEISLMDPESKATTSITKHIKAINDTAAYEMACQAYWIEKLVALESNRRFEGYNTQKQSIPFYFNVNNAQGIPVIFDKENAERITKKLMDYVKTKLNEIDTIVPLKHKPKKEQANIY